MMQQNTQKSILKQSLNFSLSTQNVGDFYAMPNKTSKKTYRVYDLLYKTLKNQFYKQELLAQYNQILLSEQTKWQTTLGKLKLAEILKTYAYDIERAKQTYFVSLFNQNSDISNYNNKLYLENAFTLKYLVNFNNKFVKQVIHKLESNEQDSATLAGSLAIDFAEKYKFNVKNHLGAYLAEHSADQVFNKKTEHLFPQIKNKIETKLNTLGQILTTEITISKQNLNRVTQLINNLLHVLILNNNQINNEYLQTAYNSMFNKINQVVFGNNVAVSQKLQNGLAPINLITFVAEYKYILNKLFVGISNINPTNNELTPPVKEQSLQIQTLIELLAQLDNQKQIKNITGKVATIMLVKNERLLLQNKINASKKILPSIIKNYNDEFNKQIENIARQNAKNELFDYAEFLTQLQVQLQQNAAVFNVTQNESNFAQNAINELDVILQEQEVAGCEYYTNYINNITLIKQEINAKRYAEYFKTIYNLRSIKLSDTTDLVQEEIFALQEAASDIYSVYYKNPDKLGEFIISYVDYVKKEVSQVINPVVRQHLLNAYSVPMLESGIITADDELLRSVEILIKRENKQYVTIKNQMQDYVTLISTQINEFSYIVEPMGVYTQKTIVAPHTVKSVVLNQVQQEVELQTEIAQNMQVYDLETFDFTQPQEVKLTKKEQVQIENDVINSDNLPEIETSALAQTELKNTTQNTAVYSEDVIKNLKQQISMVKQEAKQIKQENIKPVNIAVSVAQPEVVDIEENVLPDGKIEVDNSALNQKESEKVLTTNKITKEKTMITDNLVANNIVEFNSKPMENVTQNKDVTEKSIDQHFKEIENVNISNIDQDATQYIGNELLKQKLENFKELSNAQKIDVLNSLDLNNSSYVAPINIARIVNNTGGLDGEAKQVYQQLENANKQILEKYTHQNDDKKIAFVVLALSRRDEILNKTSAEKTIIPSRTYNLENVKDFNTCKNDLFWKMQLMAVKQNVSAEESLGAENMEEFKVISAVLKLFEIAASDNLGLSEVKIAGIGQLNYQQLARVSLLKYKEGKVDDESTTSLVSHILSNTSAYSKQPEYNTVVEDFLLRSDVSRKLRAGTTTLEQLITQDYEKNGVLKQILEFFYQKTSPNLAIIKDLDNNTAENNKITI